MTKLLRRALHGLSQRLRAAMDWPDRDELIRLRNLERRFLVRYRSLATHLSE